MLSCTDDPPATRGGAGRLVHAALLLVAVLAAPALANEPAEAQGRLEKRLVLALYDSAQRDFELGTEDPVHQRLDGPLNHLGMVVARHDIRTGPPPAGLLERSRAVLTYFHGAKDCPDWLWPWLESSVAPSGVRVVHVGSLGPLDVDGGTPRVSRWLERFGLGREADFPPFVGMPLGLDVTFRQPELCALEEDPRTRGAYCGPWNLSDSNVPWVTVKSLRDPEHVRTPVITGPWGGLALDPWFMRPGRVEGAFSDGRWHVDPFAFFTEALGLSGIPAPDPCVVSGRRAFVLHVDGDGFESISTVEEDKLAGEVFLQRIVDAYALPMTVSVIVRGLVPSLDDVTPTDRLRIAREVLGRDNVEAASHTVHHPFFWTTPGRHAWRAGARSAFLSRQKGPFSAVAEVRDSVGFIERHLLSGGKKCSVMLWSGDCAPPAEAIAEARRLGCENMNGGEFRWDRFHDSLSNVRGLGRLVDGEVQVYAGAANENLFEGFFDQSPGAFSQIDTTIERTGFPRVLKPANVYVHFYCAERPARLTSVEGLIERWAIKEPTAPVFASTYARAVRSALTTAAVLRTPAGWSLRGFGDCRTARIDHETRRVDFGRSRGVVGANLLNGSLYVQLGAPDADLVLAHRPAPRPHVVQANHVLTDVRLEESGVSFTSNAFSPRLIELGGFTAGIPVVVDVDGQITHTRANSSGLARVDLKDPGSSRVRVAVR